MKKAVLITFAVFMTEAIIHYNMGKDAKGIPETSELIKIAVVVGIFSVINGILIK